MRRFALYVMLISFAAPVASAQRYAITDLGAFTPTAINTQGRIAGNLDGHAYVWSQSKGLENLGTLVGGKASSAAAINDAGTVVGMADGPATVYGVASAAGLEWNCSDMNQAMMWTRTQGMVGLGAVGIDPTVYGESWCLMISYANGVNLTGQVVGNDDFSEDTYLDGILWTKSGGMALLPFAPLNPYNNRADSINDSGSKVGIAGCCAVLEAGHAALWNSEGLSDLGTLGGPDPEDDLYCSEANSINDSGQIVGWSTVTPDTYDTFPCGDIATANGGVPVLPVHAFVLDRSGAGGAMQDLGTLAEYSSSQAYKINSAGAVVGSSGNTLEWVYPPGRPMLVGGHAFVWTAAGGMKDLNNLISSRLGWVLNTATDIKGGQIIGSGTLHGQVRGFLLTPIR